MKRAFLSACAAVSLFAAPVQAQMLLLGVGAPIAGAPPPAYSGPGDIVASAAMWWGLRAYSTATRGNNAANVCLPLDVTCINVATDATTGALNVGAISTLGCNNTTAICTVKTLYDQTGNGFDLTQATISLRPTLVLSCISALPCMAFDGVGDTLGSIILYTRAQPFSADSAALAVTGHTTTYAAVLQESFSQWMDFYGTPGSFELFAGTGFPTQTGAADDTWNGVGGVFNGASSIAFVNTSQSATTNAGTGASSSTQIFMAGGGFGYCKCKIFETGIWPVSFTTPNINGFQSNQHSYGIY